MIRRFAQRYTSIALTAPARFATNSNVTAKELAPKPIDMAAAEQRDSKIYTMQEFIELNETEERGGKALSQKFSEARESPAWLLWGLAALGLTIMTVVVSLRIRRERMRFDPQMRQVRAIDSPGGPSIGGPFSLIDCNGKRWTNEDFKGKWMFIYFGFTNCPDICPQEMSKLSRVTAHLDKIVGPDYWQPIFVTLDPKRDTPEKLREYLKDFHPRILGLRGTPAEVDAAARQYRVYYAVPDDDDEPVAADANAETNNMAAKRGQVPIASTSGLGITTSKSDYLIDHSIITYLMTPEGKFSDYTTKEFVWFEAYGKVLRRMRDFEAKRVESGDAGANKAVSQLGFGAPQEAASSS